MARALLSRGLRQNRSQEGTNVSFELFSLIAFVVSFVYLLLADLPHER
jgi:hypothetical protein